MNGVIVVNKPQEFTSFDVVAVMRRLCGQKKVGHTGTLDPMAEGVLPILLGNATRAQDILPDSDKSYEAGFLLGKTTDTLDIWGQTQSEIPSSITKNEMLMVMEKFRGTISQLPPMYSAVKKNGVRLYDLARQGVVVEREPRTVTISQLELTAFDERLQTGTLLISCSKGTYIRSLIDDIGNQLGTGGVMTSLVRTRACGYTLDDAVKLDELKEMTREKIESLAHSTEGLFADYRRLNVSDNQFKRFSNGGTLDIARTAVRRNAAKNEIFRICNTAGDFAGLGRADIDSGVISVYKIFPAKE
ncbi:MAG: tRNA pseudouridine(55) synthase TruB [Clostridia bacterium]|nr:tRNA pseudouridine(55) synthase TruB [Clostridia bacterium]